MCVVDACMVCIEGGGVITALHHQITNLTHHHQIHQRDARAEERYAITSRTFAVKRNDFDGNTPLQSIENSLFIHASSAEQSLVKPPAMYHLQIVAPLMPLVHCRCAPYATNPPILVQLR